MAGLITYNGLLLLKGGGLAANKACCCTGVICYCFRQYANYGQITVSRFVRCYRQSYFNPVLGVIVFPDGVPGGWGDSPCQPNSAGWFFTGSNNVFTQTPWPEGSQPPSFPNATGCGGANGEGWNITPIDNATQAAACTPIGSPP